MGLVMDLFLLGQSEESMSIFHFSTSFGSVRLLCIGEWSVQSFQTKVRQGDLVKRMDELGHFDLGSQVILALPKSLRLLPQKCPRVFVGDPLAALLEKSKQTSYAAAEPNPFLRNVLSVRQEGCESESSEEKQAVGQEVQ